MNMVLVRLCKILTTFSRLMTKIQLGYLENRLEIRETIFRAPSIPCHRRMCIKGFDIHLVVGILQTYLSHSIENTWIGVSRRSASVLKHMI